MVENDVLPLPDVLAQIIELEPGGVGVLLAGLGIGPAAGAGAHFQLVMALADRQRAVYALVHQVLPDLGARGVLPQGQVADAVHALGLAQLQAQIVGHGGHQVAQAHHPVTGLALGHLRRPLDQQRHPVAALIDIGLGAPENIAGVVARGQQLGIVGHGRAAVIGSVNQNRILRQAQFLQLVPDPAHHIVAVEDEVAVLVGVGLAPELGRGQNGRMGRGQGEVEEEGLVLVGGDDLQGLVGQVVQHLLVDEVRGRGAFPEEALAGSLGHMVGQCREAVVLNIDIGRHIERPADAVVVVEAVGNGRAADGLGIIHIGAGAVVQGLGEVGALGEIHAQVPLAHGGGFITGPPEQRGHSGPAGLDQRLGVAAHHLGLEPGAPVVAAGQNAVAGGRADGGGGMGVGEGHAVAGYFVEVGRLKGAVGIQAGEISIAHIVGEDIYQVGFACHNHHSCGGFRRNLSGVSVLVPDSIRRAEPA